jgi:hypothetical protein
MGTWAASTELARSPLENSAFSISGVCDSKALSCNPSDCVNRIKQLLLRAGLTASRVSALTRVRYGVDTPFFIPPTFLYKQKMGITPHICQIVALSELTGYRFTDLMNLFGFDFNLILPLQVEIHNERTAIVTPGQPFGQGSNILIPGQLPLGRPDRRYVFAKVGCRDNVVFPKLLPGSVVRADRRYAPEFGDSNRPEDRLWLVEHPEGLTCCHVRRIDARQVVLLPNRPPLTGWPLQLSKEARILGLIDLEFRPSQAIPIATGHHRSKSENLPTVPRKSESMNLSTLLRVSRARAGLTLRAAQQMTQRVAHLLQDRNYRIPLGLLSDYEALNRLPRHIAKIISLCIIYGIDFWELMEVCGIQIDDSKKGPLFPASTGVPVVPKLRGGQDVSVRLTA